MNTIGKLFRVTTFGESHGAALGCVIDGCPSQIEIKEEDIQRDLDRRRPGQSHITTPRNEADKVKILSGVFDGKTLGSPIAMIVENSNQKSEDYDKLKDLFRPGHADHTWEQKFGFRDHRGGGRSSGRETVARVMAGAVAKLLLSTKNIQIYAYAVQVGNIKGEIVDLASIENNLLRAADPTKAKEMEAAVLAAKEAGDSLGGVVEILIKNVPVGLGEPVFGKINSDLAQAILSIPTTKAFEIGSGFMAATKLGSENNDPLIEKDGKIRAVKNDAGGISGGITNGENIILRVHVKPPSSILKKQQTINKDGESSEIQVSGRHDPCIIPRFIPVAKAMTAIVLADHLLRYRAIHGFAQS